MTKPIRKARAHMTDQPAPVLKDVLPGFFSEVLAKMSDDASMRDFVRQLPMLEIVARCSCGDAECGTFHVLSDRKLNVVEANIIGIRSGVEILALPVDGLLGISVDNFGRIGTFDVRGRRDVCDGLDAWGIAPRGL